VDSLKRVAEEARKLGIRVVQSVFEADAQVIWVQRIIQKRLDNNPEKGSKAFIVALDSDLIILGATVNLILQAKVEHEYIVGTLLKVSELKPSNHLAKQGYSFSNWTLQHWRTFAASLGNDYIRNITKKGKRFMTHKKMDLVLNLMNELEGSLVRWVLI